MTDVTLTPRQRMSLPSALLNVQVDHPADVLVVIDAAMALLERARVEIAAAKYQDPK